MTASGKIKGIITAILLAGISATAFSENSPETTTKKWTFEIEPLFGFHVGEIREHVYYPHKYGKLLSELVWEKKPLLYCGSKFTAGYRNVFFLFSAKGFFDNGKSGLMTDSDWENHNQTRNGDFTTKTKYSEHDNILDGGYELAADLSYRFRPCPLITLTPHAGVTFQHTQFSGYNGTAWYAKKIPGTNNFYPYTDTEHRNVMTFTEKLIQFEYNEFEVWTGLTVHFHPLRKLTLGLTTDVAPYTFIYYFDKHLKNELAGWTKDLLHDYFAAIKGSVNARFYITDGFFTCFDFTAMTTKPIHGTQSRKNESGTYYRQINSDIGASNAYMEFTVSAGYKF